VVYTPDAIAREMVITLLTTWLSGRSGLDQVTIRRFLKQGKPSILADDLVPFLMTATVCDPAVGSGVFLSALETVVMSAFPAKWRSRLTNWLRTQAQGWDIDSEVAAQTQHRFSQGPQIHHGDFLLDFPYAPVDLFIANPPYVRQERLDRDYKRRLEDAMQKICPNISVSSRSDYYLYFLVAMACRLKPNGVLTAIVPNGWLDNDFGSVFRHLLETRFTLEQIESLNNRRHFDAEVNTVIVTLMNRPPRKGHPIQVATDEGKRRISLATVSHLHLGWNGSLFRAPNWLLNVLSDREQVVPLEELAEIKAGIITGNNRKFYTRNRRTPSAVPVIKSPREVTRFTVRQNDCIWWLPTENVPYQIRTAPVLWPDLRGRRHFVVYNPEQLAFEHTFYGLTPRAGFAKELVLVLNSVFVNLVVEIYGRTGLGGGALRMVKRDLVHLPVPDPRRLDWPPSYFQLLEAQIPESSSIDKLKTEIDRFILTQLGLENRWDEIQNLLNFFIEQRQRRARHH